MNPIPSKTLGQRSECGMSLIVVLIMLVIIGITAASAMRSATSEQRATNNLRMESTAQQYAEAALRYCETQLGLPTGSRVATLRSNVIPTTTFALSGWEHTPTWTGALGRASATRTIVDPDNTLNILSTAGITVLPRKNPECVVETQSRGSPTFQMTVVTARGFSSDYTADGSGNTTGGSVVWLQSIINRLYLN